MNPLILVAAAAAAALAYAVSRPKKEGGQHVLDRLPPGVLEGVALAYLAYQRCGIDVREMSDSPKFETDPQGALQDIRNVVFPACPELQNIPVQERVAYGRDIFSNMAILMGYGIFAVELCPEINFDFLGRIDEDYLGNVARGSLQMALETAETSIAQHCPPAIAKGRAAAQQKGFALLLDMMP